MQQALRRSSLVPRGFVVESACYEGDRDIIAVRASASVGVWPRRLAERTLANCPAFPRGTFASDLRTMITGSLSSCN